MTWLALFAGIAIGWGAGWTTRRAVEIANKVDGG